MRFAICNEIFANWPFERICDFACELGYEGLEVAPFTLAQSAEQLSKQRRLEIRNAAESRGIEILGLHWLLVKPPGLYITHPDSAIRNKTADYLCTLVQLCADLGGKVMVIGSPKQRTLLPGVSKSQALDYAAEVFRPALAPAAKLGVTLALEPLGPKDTDFILTAAEAINLIERINNPCFRINLDVKAMYTESTPMPQIINDSAKYIAHFHANDPNLLGPGMGEIRYEPIIASLRKVGYDGWVSVETFDPTPGPERIARESIEYLKEMTK